MGGVGVAGWEVSVRRGAEMDRPGSRGGGGSWDGGIPLLLWAIEEIISQRRFL